MLDSSREDEPPVRNQHGFGTLRVSAVQMPVPAALWSLHGAAGTHPRPPCSTQFRFTDSMLRSSNWGASPTKRSMAPLTFASSSLGEASEF